ncbi:ATP-binding Cassette (ABC) Superfamily, partial [Thraustotheca clavata]
MAWVDGLVKRGASKPLTEEDLWPIRIVDSASCLSDRFQVEWTKALEKNGQPKFHQVIWKTLSREIYSAIFVYNFYAAPMLLTPIVIKSLLEVLGSPQTVVSTIGISSGYGLAGLLTALAFISVTIIDFGQYLTSILGCHAKTIAMDAVYQKSLRLSTFAKRDMTSGEITTLIAVDSERLFQGFMMGAWAFSAPISLIAMYILLGFEMGYVVGLSGGVTMLLILYLGYVSATTVGIARYELLAAQSERVKYTNELLQGVRVVKMYAWEAYVELQVAEIRARELKWLKIYQKRRLLNTIALTVAPVFSLAFCILIFIAQGNTLTPSIAFTALAYMNVGRLPCMNFSNAILAILEAETSCERIGRFLNADELQHNPDTTTTDSDKANISFQHSNFTWDADTTTTSTTELPLTLSDINLAIQPKSLTIIVGAVGSGKSSLISAILGEIHQTQGTRDVRGNISYVSQESWIQHDSLRNNILFSTPFDDAKYQQVLHACQLQADLAMLPDGDATEIGERGINLSGGQKARVSLARAMYRTQADIYLLDDPLSALDVHVAGAVFRDCVQGLLKEKMTVLVLNSHYHFLPHADRVIVMVDGRIAGDGSYDEIKHQFPSLKTLHGSDDDEKSSRVVTETQSANEGSLVTKEERNSGTVSLSTYSTYFRSSGWNGVIVWISVVFFFTFAQIVVAITDWFMGFWSAHYKLMGQMSFAWIYIAIAFVSLLLVWARSMYLMVISILCSKTLHANLFKKVLGAPVNTFFDVTPVGRILNRFSSDLDQVDSQLPLYGLFFVQTIFQIGAIVVVCAASLPYILLVYLPISVIFFMIQGLYVRPSCDLKRMDSTTRTPIVNLITETVSGISTIRAFNMVDSFQTKGRSVISYNVRFFFAYRLLARWLIMRLDWVSTLVIAGVAFLTVACKASIGPIAAGLALTYASQMTSCLSLLTGLYAMVDNFMTCVERLDEYNTLETEGHTQPNTTTPPPSWPQHGAVTFDNYSMKYRPHLDLVLKNVSINILPGQKVGICGRTGSGKSSLM